MGIEVLPVTPITATEAQTAPTIEALSFEPVNCLLTPEELSQKIEEQIFITWNGINQVST